MHRYRDKIIVYLILASLISILLPSNQISQPKLTRKNTQQFLTSLIERKPNQITIKIKRNTLKFYNIIFYENSKKLFYQSVVSEERLIQFLMNVENLNLNIISVVFDLTPKIQYEKSKIGNTINFLLICGFGFFMYRIIKKTPNPLGQMNMSGILNDKKFTPVSADNIKTKFKDVAGMHEAKFQITEFVDFLKKPDKYIEMGAKVPKGALLTGPPGTGKTLLAKACAGEAGVPFFSVSGSDFVEKYSGLGASRVRNLFQEAEKVAPSIIFIDEIDAIGKKRDSGPFSNDERDNTLNQLLVKMDGFDTKNKVIVMAATNRKDMLDPALLRPGRFDRSVEIGLPNMEERAEILKVHLKKVKFDESITEDELAKKIARITPGFSGAELANTCNEAAILAARDKLDSIPLQKFEKATERVLAGLEKRNMFSDEEKQMLAFYEAGKAVGNWFTEGADPVIKISILPFSKSKAGYSHSIKDETALNTKDELLSKVCCYLAGRSAEQYFKGYVTTNGQKDLERAKKIITMIVTKFGMSDAVKMFAFPDFDFIKKPYGEKMETLIDNEINKIMRECQVKVEEIIKSREDLIIKLKSKLLEKETLTHNDIKQVLGDRPFAGSENYSDFLRDQEEEDMPKGAQGPGSGVASS